TRSYNRRMLDTIAKTLKQRHKVASFWYGNFVEETAPESGWHTYPALPRFGSHYRGLLGRLDVLLETYSYLSFSRRCAVIRAWLTELVRFAAKNGAAMTAVTREEEAAIIARGSAGGIPDSVAIHHGVAKRDERGALLFDFPAYQTHDDWAAIPSFD